MEMSAIGVMYMRAVREAWRVRVATVVIPLVLPLFVLTIFAEIFSSLTSLEAFGDTGTYVTYIAPAAVLMGAMLGSSTSGISTAMELQTGFLSRVRVSSMSVALNLAVRRLADASRLATFGLVLTFVAGVSGAEIENWPLALAMAVAFAAMWGVAYGGLTLSVCIRTANIETAQALIPLFFPILFMSTALVPMELLPSWLQSVAEYNPVSYICDAMRSAQAGAFDADAMWYALAGIGCVGLGTQVLVRLAERQLFND